MSDVPEVSVTDLPPGAALVDVREHDEYAAGHVDGAVHVPLSEVPQRMSELPAGEPLYVMCRSGNRSGRAAAWLNAQGIESVNVAGGMLAWAAAGKPMTSSDGAPRVL
ncbi:rhodanese-like domain-containing protein [Angustibacter sp. Root456]|uniref:rhodanese-like domain-containing protein n=1 Tax=Angustibacter sp. Root456 TaxID=1736539 RepID=UPI0006FF3F71|nr:rhodanese-like domain-containing protein [Angustibacter sp. Root456]KQX61800.1 sulfurtransferase [Angustibacter sp. Root456]